MRELFVYYKVPVDRTGPALREALALQAGLRALVPRLQARLLRRGPADDGCETWMETYALGSDAADPAGLDAAVQALIESQAQVMQRWTRGERHTEVFVACPEPQPQPPPQTPPRP